VWWLVLGWKSEGRDIRWAEAISFEFLVKHIMQTAIAGAHVKVFGDNIGVVKGWWTGQRRNRQVNLVFRCIHDLLQQHNGTVHTWYIPSKKNPANPPSRGIYAGPNLLLPHISIPFKVISHVVDFDDPIIHTW
jgi:hypothetical protein